MVTGKPGEEGAPPVIGGVKRYKGVLFFVFYGIPNEALPSLRKSLGGEAGRIHKNKHGSVSIFPKKCCKNTILRMAVIISERLGYRVNTRTVPIVW